VLSPAGEKPVILKSISNAMRQASWHYHISIINDTNAWCPIYSAVPGRYAFIQRFLWLWTAVAADLHIVSAKFGASKGILPVSISYAIVPSVY